MTPRQDLTVGAQLARYSDTIDQILEKYEAQTANHGSHMHATFAPSAWIAAFAVTLLPPASTLADAGAIDGAFAQRSELNFEFRSLPPHHQPSLQSAAQSIAAAKGKLRTCLAKRKDKTEDANSGEVAFRLESTPKRRYTIAVEGNALSLPASSVRCMTRVLRAQRAPSDTLRFKLTIKVAKKSGAMNPDFNAVGSASPTKFQRVDGVLQAHLDAPGGSSYLVIRAERPGTEEQGAALAETIGRRMGNLDRCIAQEAPGHRARFNARVDKKERVDIDLDAANYETQGAVSCVLKVLGSVRYRYRAAGRATFELIKR